jgi:membrane protein implicated in regulation of membrane protease activity
MLLVTAVVLMIFVVPTWLGVVLVAAALAAEIGELVLWRRFLDRIRVTTGAEGLIGATGEAITACDPDGSVRVRGEIWRARADPAAARGERVVVEAVDGLTLDVAPAPARRKAGLG